MITFAFVGFSCDFLRYLERLDFFLKKKKKMFKYVEESIFLPIYLSMNFWTFHTGTRFYETTMFNVSPLPVSCFQPQPESKYRALSLARLVTKLQRGHYTEVKHDAIFELRRRCLIAS